jgi:two-component system chemotaxis response regulator CheB
MTGMGRDGLKVCQLIKSNGGKIIAQDEASCIVYGMPKAVFEANLVDSVCSVERITDEIIKYCT